MSAEQHYAARIACDAPIEQLRARRRPLAVSLAYRIWRDLEDVYPGGAWHLAGCSLTIEQGTPPAPRYELELRARIVPAAPSVDLIDRLVEHVDELLVGALAQLEPPIFVPGPPAEPAASVGYAAVYRPGYWWRAAQALVDMASREYPLGWRAGALSAQFNTRGMPTLQTSLAVSAGELDETPSYEAIASAVAVLLEPEIGPLLPQLWQLGIKAYL